MIVRACVSWISEDIWSRPLVHSRHGLTTPGFYLDQGRLADADRLYNRALAGYEKASYFHPCHCLQPLGLAVPRE